MQLRIQFSRFDNNLSTLATDSLKSLRSVSRIAFSTFSSRSSTAPCIATGASNRTFSPSASLMPMASQTRDVALFP